MPDILLFGATGYTGRLTAYALARRGADFAIAGRNKDKLDEVADGLGSVDVRVARVGDLSSLAAALEDVRVLVTCVGPFVKLGHTAVEAALTTGTHYIDVTGESAFIAWLKTIDVRARAAGIAVAPALGFDEVPADLAATLATQGMDSADLVLTYALGRGGSAGTIRTALGITRAPGQWIENGQPKEIRAGQEQRWAPMPPPLGPRLSVAFPFAEGQLAPLHLDLDSLKLFATVGSNARLALRVAPPLVDLLLRAPGADRALERLLPSGSGPDEQSRPKRRWTILAEARSGDSWRNVAIQGRDQYGLTAELLATGALRMAEDGYAVTGLVAPVEAVEPEIWQKELIDQGVSIDTFGPV